MKLRMFGVCEGVSYDLGAGVTIFRTIERVDVDRFPIEMSMTAFVTYDFERGEPFDILDEKKQFHLVVRGLFGERMIAVGHPRPLDFPDRQHYSITDHHTVRLHIEEPEVVTFALKWGDGSVSEIRIPFDVAQEDDEALGRSAGRNIFVIRETAF